jgi:hypothetical protein
MKFKMRFNTGFKMSFEVRFELRLASGQLAEISSCTVVYPRRSRHLDSFFHRRSRPSIYLIHVLLMRSLTPIWSLPLLPRHSLYSIRALNTVQSQSPKRRPWLGREEILKRIDDHTRSHFPGEPVEVVEEVVRARNGIWAGLRGRKTSLYPNLCKRLTS